MLAAGAGVNGVGRILSANSQQRLRGSGALAGAGAGVIGTVLLRV